MLAKYTSLEREEGARKKKNKGEKRNDQPRTSPCFTWGPGIYYFLLHARSISYISTKRSVHIQKQCVCVCVCAVKCVVRTLRQFLNRRQGREGGGGRTASIKLNKEAVATLWEAKGNQPTNRYGLVWSVRRPIALLLTPNRSGERQEK